MIKIARMKNNAAHLTHKVFEQYDDFLLAHVEFDDQGQFWEDERTKNTPNPLNQLEALESHINTELKYLKQ